MGIPTGFRHRIMSAATTNSTLVKSSRGRVFGVNLCNVGVANAFLKLYNKATAPIIGTDTPVETICIPAGWVIYWSIPILIGFPLGIGLGITSLVADSDTTAIVLNQITGALYYA